MAKEKKTQWLQTLLSQWSPANNVREERYYYQSEILHKIPIQDQQGSLGWYRSLGKEHTGRFQSASYFLGHLHQMKTITRSSNK